MLRFHFDYKFQIANLIRNLKKHISSIVSTNYKEFAADGNNLTPLSGRFERFFATYRKKYPKAADRLARDKEESLPFYGFPSAHWRSLWTTNPIESTFATIRLRTAKTRNCLSEKAALSLVHQLAMSAEKRWRQLRGFRHLADVVADVKFTDEVDVIETGSRATGFRTAIHQI